MQPVNATFQTLIDKDSRFPIARVKSYPTTKTVPSKGFNASYYALANDTDMILTDWWSGLPTSLPADRESEGTFLSGSSILEPSTAMAHDWGVGGVPGPIIGRSDLWAARWFGSFFPRYSGVYRFYVDTSPFARIRIKIGSTYYGTGANPFLDSDANPVDRWDPSDGDFERTRQELYFDVPALTQGVWPDISIEFQVPRFLDPQNMPTYLCVKYREPDATTNLDLWGNSGGDIVTDYQSDHQDADGIDIKKTLSAGVVNTTAAFLAGEDINGLLSLSGDYKQNEVSTFQLEVGLPATTNLNGALSGGETVVTVDSTDGFPAVGALNIESDIISYTGVTGTSFTGCSGVGSHSDDALVSQIAGEGAGQYVDGYNPLTNSIGQLSMFGLVQIEGGLYDGVSADHYADRLWGHVSTNPVVNRDKKTASVTISDTSRLLNEQYNRNYPNSASYSMAGYYSKFTETNPDGISRPVCYDRWDIEDALRDILIKANIDPVLLYQRARHNVTGSFAADYGDYLIKGGLVLDSKPRYGYPVNTADNGADDVYVWAFGYGTALIENITEIIKNYSYQFNINHNGFVRAQPFGWADLEFSPDDTLAQLDFVGASWDTDADNLNNLDVFKARYRQSSNPGDTVSLAATLPYWNDADIIVQRHDGANQKIKVKVGGVYVTELIIDGLTVSGTGGGGDEFALAARAAGTTWSYYDGIDPALGVNPSVIKIAAPLSYAQRDLDVEVVSGQIRFDAIFLYKQSTRTSIVSIGNDQMGTLKMSLNIIDQRNETDVIGAPRGLFKNVGGAVINPRNPVYVHTVSRAIDLASIYDESSNNYIGRAVPVEIYDQRIYDQDRADFVATFGLERYRKVASSGSTKIVFNPVLETGDSISMTDEHSGVLNDTQGWIRGMSESFSIDANGLVSYATTLSNVDPREPMPSMRAKAAVDIADFDDEPIINIALYHQGFRISGNDSTLDINTNTVTIATDPGWDTDMWVGHFFRDQIPSHGARILSNTSDQLVLSEDTLGAFGDGNWCISFDPLDSEALGAPIEIRYDQIVDAKIDLYVADVNMHRIADLTLDTRDTIQEWGPNKVIYWTGILNHGFALFKGDFYVSPFTLEDFSNRMPLIIVFNVIYNTDGLLRQSVIKSHPTGDDVLSTVPSSMTIDGIDMVNNSLGAAKIVPGLLDGGYYITPQISASSDNSILDAGRLYKYTVITPGITIRLFIEGRGSGHANPFVVDEYNGKHVVCGRNGNIYLITDTGLDANDGWIDVTGTSIPILFESQLEADGFTGHYSPDHIELPKTADVGDWPWVKIVEPEYPAHFKESDNNNLGVIITFQPTDFYVEGYDTSLFLSGFLPTILAVGSTVYLTGLSAKYSTVCENELTIHHQGNTYTIPAGSLVKHAQVGDYDHYEDTREVIDEYILFSFGYQIYWSMHDPERLFFSAGLNPDAHESVEGLFVIAEIYLNISGTGVDSEGIITDATFDVVAGRKIASDSPNKPQSVVTLPTYEIHQLSTPAGGGFSLFQGQQIPANPESTNPLSVFGFNDANIEASETGLSGYDNFQSIKDVNIQFNIADLYNDENNDPIYFGLNLQDGAEINKALWHFLIKLEVYDRAGRPPINMSASIPESVEPDTDDGEIRQGFTASDYFGLSVFWEPISGYTSSVLNGWLQFARGLTVSLNISKAMVLKIWTKT